MSALTDLFTNIANAIRAKSGDTAAIPATQFATAISELDGGAHVVNNYNGLVSYGSTPATFNVPQAIGCNNLIIVGRGNTQNPNNYNQYYIIKGIIILDGSGFAYTSRITESGTKISDGLLAVTWNSTTGKAFLNVPGVTFWLGNRTCIIYW